MFASTRLLVLAPYLCGCASQLMLFPGIARMAEQRLPAPPVAGRQRAERTIVKNESGSLIHGLLFASGQDVGTVMVSGGNAMSREQTLYYYRFLLGEGFRVLVFSFQGINGNDGKADLASLVGDAATFLNEIRRRYPAEKVAYVGDSSALKRKCSTH